MDAKLQQLTDDERATVAGYIPFVEAVVRKRWPPKGQAGYARSDLAQVGLLALVESVLRWREAAVRQRVPLRSLIAGEVLRAVAGYARTNRRIVHVPRGTMQAVLRGDGPAYRMRADTIDKALRSERVELAEAHEGFRHDARWGHKGRPLPLRHHETPDGIAGDDHQRLHLAIMEAASCYTGKCGQAADLLLAERLFVSSKAYRTGYVAIGQQTGLSAGEVVALEKRVLASARRMVEDRASPPGTPGRRNVGVEVIQAGIASGGERARAAVFAVVATFGGRNAVPAILVAATRLLPADAACRAKRAELAAWTGISAAMLKYLERRIVREARKKLEVAA